MIQSGLITQLQTQSSAVYANEAPQTTAFPYVTVTLDGYFAERHFSTGGYQTGFEDTDFQISVFGKTAESTYALAKNIESTIENASGIWLGGDSPQTVYNVSDVEITGKDSDFDPFSELYEYSIFITVTHK